MKELFKLFGGRVNLYTETKPTPEDPIPQLVVPATPQQPLVTLVFTDYTYEQYAISQELWEGVKAVAELPWAEAIVQIVEPIRASWQAHMGAGWTDPNVGADRKLKLHERRRDYEIVRMAANETGTLELDYLDAALANEARRVHWAGGNVTPDGALIKIVGVDADEKP